MGIFIAPRRSAPFPFLLPPAGRKIKMGGRERAFREEREMEVSARALNIQGSGKGIAEVNLEAATFRNISGEKWLECLWWSCFRSFGSVCGRAGVCCSDVYCILCQRISRTIKFCSARSLRKALRPFGCVWCRG